MTDNPTTESSQSTSQYDLSPKFGNDVIDEGENAVLAQTEASIDEEKRLEDLQKKIEEQFGSELKRRFDDTLDAEGPIYIAGGEFFPSLVLFTLDDDLYRQALIEFQQREISEAVENVVRGYPTPIAYHFYIATNEDNPAERRFAALKDTWEALIYLLFAIVLGEFTARGLPLRISNKPTWRYLCEWKLAAKLEIIQRLYDYAQQKGYTLSCQKVLSPDLLARIGNLNRVRNEYAHSAAWSKTQTKEYLDQYLSEVVAILRLTQELQNIRLLRYIEGTEIHTRPRFNVFTGRYLDHDTKVHDVSKVAIHDPSVLNDNNILIMHDSQIYTICPWYHFVIADAGHTIRLCYFKSQDNTSLDLEFEILGQARKQDFPAATFTTQISQIETLLRSGGTTI